jgi:hypothetical protein
MKKNGGESWPTPGAAIATIDNTVFRRTQKKKPAPSIIFWTSLHIIQLIQCCNLGTLRTSNKSIYQVYD